MNRLSEAAFYMLVNSSPGLDYDIAYIHTHEGCPSELLLYSIYYQCENHLAKASAFLSSVTEFNMTMYTAVYVAMKKIN